MTHKQIAKELIDKFKGFVARDYGYDEEPLFELQKECALIAVEEKNSTLLSIIGNQMFLWTEHQKEVYDELQKVKSEILNL